MASLVWTNNASSTLASSIGSGATSLTVAAGTGSIFPSISSGQTFKVTLSPASGTTPAQEIVLVTAISTDTMTIVRAQEGTIAQNWGTGSLVQNLITAGEMATFLQVTPNNGNPNGSVAGQQGTSALNPSLAYDYADNLLFYCTATGTTSTAQWVGLAPLVSPAFTGTPTAPTATGTDNSTKIATTAFVKTAISTLAPLASPSFTGTPTAPTASQADSSTRLATTAGLQTASQGLMCWGTDSSGTPNVINASTSPAVTSYVAGLAVRVKIANTFTGGSTTLNLNGVGATAVKTFAGVNPVANSVKAGWVCEFVYDGTQFVLTSASAAGFTVTTGTTGGLSWWIRTAPDGWIEMGGQTPSFSGEGSATLTYPGGGFPNSCLSADSWILNPTSTNRLDQTIQVVSYTTTQLTMYIQSFTTSLTYPASGLWRASGY